MATDIHTLAEQCGVSAATVSRVFTGRARVSDAVRAKVLAAARELDYRPQQVMARDCVAIVIGKNKAPDFRLRFTERLLAAAIQEITRRGLLTEIITPEELPGLYNAYTKAVLLLLSEPEIEACRAILETLPMPILTVNKSYPFSSSVNTDHGQGVQLALAHLAASGHRRIALTLDRMNNQAGTERRNAYLSFMAQRNFAPMPIILYAEEEFTKSRKQLDWLLQEKPSAIIFCGESIALPAVHDLLQRGIRIPEEISVITSELTGISCWQTPAITAIDQNIDLLATETIKQLLRRIREPHAGQFSLRLPSMLIERGSVARLCPAPCKTTGSTACRQASAGQGL